MVLVPGAHVLNGLMDLSSGAGTIWVPHVCFMRVSSCGDLRRIAAGTWPARRLPAGGPAREGRPLWLDIIAAGVAVAGFSVFFSMPLRMLGWPAAVGMLAHALRWWTSPCGFGVATGALVACLVSDRCSRPSRTSSYAVCGHRLCGGGVDDAGRLPVQDVQRARATRRISADDVVALRATFADGMTAVMIILAMSLGVIVPKIAIDRLTDSATRSKS